MIRINDVDATPQRNSILIFLGPRWRSRRAIASRLRRFRTRLHIPQPTHILQHHRKGVPDQPRRRLCRSDRQHRSNENYQPIPARERVAEFHFDTNVNKISR